MPDYTLIYVNPISTRTNYLAKFGDDKDAAVRALRTQQAAGTFPMGYMVFDADDPERGYLDADDEFPGARAREETTDARNPIYAMRAITDLNNHERSAMEAAWCEEQSPRPPRVAYEWGWLAARDYYRPLEISERLLGRLIDKMFDYDLFADDQDVKLQRVIACDLIRVVLGEAEAEA